MRLKIAYWAITITSIAALSMALVNHSWWQIVVVAVLVELRVLLKERATLSEFKQRILNLRDQSMTILRAQEKRIEELERRD